MVQLTLILTKVANKATCKNLRARNLEMSIQEIRRVQIGFLASKRLVCQRLWIICHHILKAPRKWRTIRVNPISSQTNKFWRRITPKRPNSRNQERSPVQTEGKQASYRIRLRANSICHWEETQADATWVWATPHRMSLNITHLIRFSCKIRRLGT